MFSGFKNPEAFQHCYLVKTKGANEQAAKTTSHLPLLLVKCPPPHPEKAINKGDYILVHYLIFTRLVSAEANALKNLYLKIGSTSPSLRLVSERLWASYKYQR